MDELAPTRTQPGTGESVKHEPPSIALRLLRLLLLIAALAFCTLLGRALISDQSDWRPRANGARVRLYSASYGNYHSIRYPTSSWYVHITRDVPAMTWRELLDGGLWTRNSLGSSVSNTAPMTMLYFQLVNHPGPLKYEIEVDDDDGSPISNAGEFSLFSPSSTYQLADVELQRFPRKRPVVQVHMKFDGIPHTFEIKNPAYAP